MIRRRLLWVTEEVPDPDGGGGAIRQAALLAGLARHVEVTLVCPAAVPASVAASVGEVVVVPVPRRALDRVRASLAFRVARRPLVAAAAGPVVAALGAEVARRSVDHDAVVVHHEALLPLLDRIVEAPRVFHAFDVQSRRARQAADAGAAGPVDWAAEAERVRRHEARHLPDADLLVACTDADLAELEGLGGWGPGTGGVVVPNGVDLARFAATPAPGAGRVLFLGSLDYQPNVDGITWFVEHVWPLVRAARPEATLTVAGHRPVPEVRALHGRPGVTVVGPVPEAAAVLADHDVAVVPLRVGTGSRLKALEAMAAGRAVVGTTIGLEGLGLDGPPAPGTRPPAVVADDPVALAAAVAELVADPSAAAAAGAAGRAHVAGRFDWDGIADRMAEQLGAALGWGGDPAAPGVLVCTRDRPALLEEALRSVAADLPPGGELVVVDAGRSGAPLPDLGVPVRHVVAPRPGKSRQLNRGLRLLGRDVVVLTDDDCRVPPGWIGAMAAPFSAPEVGVAFGNVVGLSGVRGVASVVVPAGPAPRWSWEYANGAAMAVRRRAALALGGYDERLGPGAPAHGEEHDLLLRLEEAGWRSVVTGADPVAHLEWRDDAETRGNLLVYSRGAGAFLGLALRRSPRRSWPLVLQRARYQRSLWHHADREGRAFGPATAWAFARGLAHGVRRRPWRRDR